jgi:hypothetical protein
MSPSSKRSKALIYVGDEDTSDVYVYDYKSGKPVGTLTGFDEPYGMCVDAKGDIYIANYAGGTVVEYAHGGSTPINTYVPGGSPIGCALDAKGDVAATSFDPGEVTVYAQGNPNNGTTYSDSSCEYMWSMAYDLKGNLVGFGEDGDGKLAVCGLLAGSKTMTTLSTSGFTIDLARGTSWDGKYLAFDNGDAYESGIVQVTVKGSTLTYAGETILSDDCYKDYVDVVPLVIIGKTNSLFNGKQGNTVVGPNVWCPGSVDSWHYPAGGLPYTYVGLRIGSSSYGGAISLAP